LDDAKKGATRHEEIPFPGKSTCGHPGRPGLPGRRQFALKGRRKCLVPEWGGGWVKLVLEEE
jgi:hypothetical protein